MNRAFLCHYKALFIVERGHEWCTLSVQYVNDASSVCYIPSIIFIHFSLPSSVRGKVTLMHWSGFPLPFPISFGVWLCLEAKKESIGFLGTIGLGELMLVAIGAPPMLGSFPE